jgi:hypothetical protein
VEYTLNRLKSAAAISRPLEPDVEAVGKVIFHKFAVNKIKYLRSGK